MKTLSRIFVCRLALALGLLALAAPAVADAEQAPPESGSYGYFRIVEGAASVAPAGTGERENAEVNRPVVAGDHLWVPARSRVEIALADRNVLRVDGGSELILERLAASPDRGDRATVVRLLEGNLQLVVAQDSLGEDLPRVDTPSAAIYPQHYGVYRITADHDGWSQVVVRRGTAEVVADGDSSTVKADEEAVIDNRAPGGGPGNRATARIANVREAGGFDGLERWGRQLDDDYQGADLGYVNDNLRYAAAPLARYGAWIDYQGTAYWRPRVEAAWRPYWLGRWAYLPSGLTWISSEPWGWVPYHYGSWDYLPDYGWVWQPGAVWAPAWVYWYWGPSYVGWCPTGYYTHYYAGQLGPDVGFRSGVYGWAGGDWGLFDRWSFVSTSYFGAGYRAGYRNGYWDGHRDVRRYAVPVDRFRNGRPLERGIITTDTRPLRPDTWKDPQAVLNALRRSRGSLGELPDVTPFIARRPRPNLPPAVTQAVTADNPRALDGTPLRPGTLRQMTSHGRPDVLPGGRTPDHAPAAGRPIVREMPAPNAAGAPRPTPAPQYRPMPQYRPAPPPPPQYRPAPQAQPAPRPEARPSPPPQRAEPARPPKQHGN